MMVFLCMLGLALLPLIISVCLSIINTLVIFWFLFRRKKNDAGRIASRVKRKAEQKTAAYSTKKCKRSFGSDNEETGCEMNLVEP